MDEEDSEFVKYCKRQGWRVGDGWVVVNPNAVVEVKLTEEEEDGNG